MLHNAGTGRKDIVRQLRFDFFFGAPQKKYPTARIEDSANLRPKGRRVQTGSHYLLYLFPRRKISKKRKKRLTIIAIIAIITTNRANNGKKCLKRGA